MLINFNTKMISEILKKPQVSHSVSARIGLDRLPAFTFSLPETWTFKKCTQISFFLLCRLQL